MPQPGEHIDGCPAAAALVPLWCLGVTIEPDDRPEYGGRGSAYRDCTSVHYPPAACALCGRPVWYSDRTTRSKGARRADGRKGNVYCSPGCKADAPSATRLAQIATHREEVFAAAARAVAANVGRGGCPWPGKRAYDTREQAEVHNAAILAADAVLQPYHCAAPQGCGKFHLGHPRRDVGQSIGAIARVSS